MPYQLAITVQEDYLHVRIEGDNTLQTVLDYTAELYLECMKRNCWKVLVEENLQGPAMSLIDVYQAASEASDKVQRPALMAFVDINPQHPQQNMEFAGKVALNRGLNIRVFANVPDAETWIRQAPTPSADEPTTSGR